MLQHVKKYLFETHSPGGLTIAQHGISYDAVKRAATKVLSQGLSPSIQRIRAELGTGSHTTIAAHLKAWHEERISKEVYHLPSNMPKELIAVFETGWHIALEQAEQQFIAFKHALTEQGEKWQHEKQQMLHTHHDMEQHITLLNQKLEDNHHRLQQYQTDLVLCDDRLKNRENEIQEIKKQHENRFKHVINEKHEALEKIVLLQKTIEQAEEKISEQAKKYDTMLEKERNRQDQSEQRWIAIIEDIKKTNRDLQKKYQDTVQKHLEKITQSQEIFEKTRNEITVLQTTLKHKDTVEQDLKHQLKNTQQQYIEAVAQLNVQQLKSADQARELHRKRKVKK